MIHVVVVVSAKPRQRENALQAFRANAPTVLAKAEFVAKGNLARASEAKVN